MWNDDTLSLKKLSSGAFRLGSRVNTCLCAPWKLACSNSITWPSRGPPETVGAAFTACNDDMSSFLIPVGRPGYKLGPRIGGYCLWKFESAKKAQLRSSTINDDTLSLKKLSSGAFRLGSRVNTCLCAPWKLACSNSITWLLTGPPETVGAASTGCNDDMSSFLIPVGRPGYKPGPRIGGYCLWKFESAKKAQLPSSTTNDDTLSLKKLSSGAFRLDSRVNTCLCAP